MIIRNEILSASFNSQNDRNNQWYSQLSLDVQAMVRPVPDSFTTGETGLGSVIIDAGFLPTNLYAFPEVMADESQVDSGGTPRAFSLSLADVARLSGSDRAFPSNLERLATGENGWWLRTPSTNIHAWNIFPDSGGLSDGGARDNMWGARGTRPALIVHQ